MSYTKKTYVNGTTPAINATNLNSTEQGIYDAQLYGSDSGGDDTYVLDLDTTLATGLTVRLTVTTANTGAATLSIDNGSVAKDIRKITSTGLADVETGDIIAGSTNTLVYDGTYWLLQNTVPSNTWIVIETKTIAAGGAASTTFSSVPTSYSFIKLIFSVQSETSTSRDINMVINSYTTASQRNTTAILRDAYDVAYASNNSALVLTNAVPENGYIGIGEIIFQNQNGVKRSYIGNSQRYTTATSNQGWPQIHSGYCGETGQISTLAISISGDEFAQGSKFTLLGLK